MTGSELSALRRRLGISQETLARIIGVSVRTVARWEASRSAPSPMAARQLRALEQLDRHLQCVFRPESIPGWLERPIERLEGRIPRDMLTHEGVEALLRFVLEMMPAEI